MMNAWKSKRNFFCDLRIIFAMAMVIHVPSMGWSFEDDDRPYTDFAKPVGRTGEFSLPKTVGSYDYWAPIRIQNYLEKIDAKTDRPLTPDENRQCSEFHARSTRDQILDIRYALGYFDESKGESYLYGGFAWGNAASMDEGVWLGIRKVLMGPCVNESRRLCGFSEITPEAERRRNGKTVLARPIQIQGRSVEVRLTLTYASASPFYERNKTVLKDKQDRFTAASEENFFDGLRRADYVFYMGHSRNGGGPDFNPPRLNSIGRDDYMGYYRKVFPGRTRMLGELSKKQNPDVTVGLFSCDSALHFRRRLEGVRKDQSMILTIGSTGQINYEDTLVVSMGYLEGLLRGQCGARLESFARVTDREKSTFTGLNLK